MKTKTITLEEVEDAGLAYADAHDMVERLAAIVVRSRQRLAAARKDLKIFRDRAQRLRRRWQKQNA